MKGAPPLNMVNSWYPKLVVEKLDARSHSTLYLVTVSPPSSWGGLVKMRSDVADTTCSVTPVGGPGTTMGFWLEKVRGKREGRGKK